LEEAPIVLNDFYAKKQVDKYLSPIKENPEVTLKHFRYNSNHNDSERIKVITLIFINAFRKQLSYTRVSTLYRMILTRRRLR
jgi:hypothetical protein